MGWLCLFHCLVSSLGILALVFLPKITDVLVAIDIKISDDVIFFGRGVNNVALVLGEMNQVHSVLLRVQGSFVHPPFAIVDDNLSKKKFSKQVTNYISLIQ